VLLHTSWKFNGLAGILMLLTVIIVASGFIGRYIYTAIPRTADGVEIEAADLENEVQALEAELKGWEQQETQDETRAQDKQLKKLQKRQRLLRRQVVSLATARRTLSLWHSVHIPIGMALFTAALIHSGAALYYATLLR
jgi:hypothetical protein